MPATPIVVTGVVRGPANDPVPQARVYIAGGPVPVPDIAALTDAEGRFTMSLPAAGTYEFACTAEAYMPSSTTVEVAENQTLPVELRLPADRPHH